MEKKLTPKQKNKIRIIKQLKRSQKHETRVIKEKKLFRMKFQN